MKSGNSCCNFSFHSCTMAKTDRIPEMKANFGSTFGKSCLKHKASAHKF